jgi:WXG100 family type VII secretion target
VDTWDGEAKAAYAARQAKWTAASNDLKAILNSIKGAVNESAADYMSTEKRATGLFQ